MFKELGQLGSLLKQAQSMSGKVQEAREAMARREFVGQSSDGLVTVRLSGQGVLLACHIDPELLSPARQVAAEAGVIEAMGQAQSQLQEATAALMSEMTGGLDLGALGASLGNLGFGPKG
ncbi:YbaB/EbfC family nucleoid-associated protein [bacterium]|nr:YbaB/EbfC family nucleoid-associated protein [bacterium]